MSVEWTGVERRRARRKTVDQTVMLSLSGGATVTPCAMRNLSVLGAGILLKILRSRRPASTYRSTTLERASPAASYGVGMLSPGWSSSIRVPRPAHAAPDEGGRSQSSPSWRQCRPVSAVSREDRQSRNVRSAATRPAPQPLGADLDRTSRRRAPTVRKWNEWPLRVFRVVVRGGGFGRSALDIEAQAG